MSADGWVDFGFVFRQYWPKLNNNEITAVVHIRPVYGLASFVVASFEVIFVFGCCCSRCSYSRFGLGGLILFQRV